MRKILEFLCVIQKKKVKDTSGFHRNMLRINPYNPLSYVVVLLVPVVALVLFGIAGMWKEIELENPFKWT